LYGIFGYLIITSQIEIYITAFCHPWEIAPKRSILLFARAVVWTCLSPLRRSKRWEYRGGFFEVDSLWNNSKHRKLWSDV